MTSPDLIDGTLSDWEEVAGEAEWGALLLGNGLSINVWGEFKYGSLFAQAKLGSRHGGLDKADLAMFEAYGTENFEVVLENLNTAASAAEALGLDSGPYVERYRSVQSALGAAVRAVHISRPEVPDRTLEAIKDVMDEQKAIFTTSYDLLVYWATMWDDRPEPLIDYFWAKGMNAFDPDWVAVNAGRVPVYFLHGALHLVVGGDGSTRKLTWKEETVLDQFGEPIESDPRARPLLISEGTSREKLRVIEGNDYLSFALRKLRACSDPLVIFGSSLSDQDQHLVDAINATPARPVAVSMRGADETEIRARQHEICSRLHSRELHFFKAETYPLGSRRLAYRRMPTRILREKLGR